MKKSRGKMMKKKSKILQKLASLGLIIATSMSLGGGVSISTYR